LFLQRFLQEFLLFGENEAGIGGLNEFMSGIGLALVQQEHGEVESNAGIMQFLGREFLQDRDSFGNSTLRI
jgi:hypothetical protein